MDQDAALNTIERFRNALIARGVERPDVVLFGSYAHGTPHEGSDIDLVVVSGSFDGMGYWERIEILAQAVYELLEPIEAVAVTSEKWARADRLILQFAREGQVVQNGQLAEPAAQLP